ncbi:hypothetical protein Tco_1169135, partial [Tanacetum coccineum]
MVLVMGIISGYYRSILIGLKSETDGFGASITIYSRISDIAIPVCKNDQSFKHSCYHAPVMRHAGHVHDRLVKDIKTSLSGVFSFACRKVIVARERKKQRAEEHLASKAAGKVGSKRRVAQEGTSRKRKTPATAPSSSEQVSSPQPINQVVPNQPLVTENVRESALDARLDILRDQTDEPLDAGHAQSLARDDSGPGPRDDDRGERGENDGRNDGQHVGPNVEGGDENDDQNVSQHPPAHRTGGEKTVSTGESSASPFGELPFAPVWGITDSDRMVKFRHCRDMMSNIFTFADLASFEGMDDREAVRRSWK